MLRWVIGFMLAMALLVVPAAAKRVALVIGNGNYEHATTLPNPPNDAHDIAEALEAIDFTVFSGTDLTRAGMESLLRDFVRQLADAELALFFYAGHGMQVNGKNYLVPVDAKLEDATALTFETIDADMIYQYLGGEQRVALVFLDACRDNPLARSFARTQPASRSTGDGGLAPTTTTGTGLFIGFATSPNDVAADGEGRNSPFTAALLRHLAEPGVEIQQLMTRVKADVRQATNDNQRPWHNSDLSTEVYLVPASAATLASTTTVAAPAYSGDDEEFAWELVKSGLDAEALRTFVSRFPSGKRAGQAQALLTAITRRDEAPAARPGARYDRDLSLAVQRELNRLGCGSSPIDGKWGPLSAAALTDLARKTGIPFDTLAPSQDLLSLTASLVDNACRLDSASAMQPKFSSEGCPALYAKWLTLAPNKAWATSADGSYCGFSYGYSSMDAAHVAAIKGCRQNTDRVCTVREDQGP